MVEDHGRGHCSPSDAAAEGLTLIPSAGTCCKRPLTATPENNKRRVLQSAVLDWALPERELQLCADRAAE